MPDPQLRSVRQPRLYPECVGGAEDWVDLLDLDRLRAAPLEDDPFDFVLVEKFVRIEALPAILADFPVVRGAGSFPVECVDYGVAFAALVAALTGPALAREIAEKFAVDLDGRPTMLTVRGFGDRSDGRIHTDSASKIITLLLYLNAGWEPREGRLRLLRGPDDLEDFACEVAPLAGTMLAFRRSPRSFHGHRPFLGERRALQLNWVTDAAVVRRELARHRWSARIKSANPFRAGSFRT
jgi:SM-20-related protein